MSKTIEIPDIAMWEETDSELAKYTIGKLQEENKKLKEKLDVAETNEETFRLEMQETTKILGLDEHTIYDDVKLEIENIIKEKRKQKQIIDKAIEYIKTYIEIDEETGTYSMPYSFDGYNLYKILKMLEGEDNE